MYSQEDIKVIEKELKKFLLYFILATILFLTFLVATCINWGTVLDPIRMPSWSAYIAGVIYVAGAVFTWGLFGMRLIKYRSFVNNILTGLEHSIQGKVISVDKDISYDNDLGFYSIKIMEDNEEENRLLYLDAMKEIDNFEVGKNVKLKTFGNYVKDVMS